MSTYSSNCPVSRPAEVGWREDDDFGGISWNDKHGFFIPTENPMLPIKQPVTGQPRE